MEIKIKWIKRKQMTHENTYRDDTSIIIFTILEIPVLYILQYWCIVNITILVLPVLLHYTVLEIPVL